MNAAIFCLSVLAIVAIGRWALKQIRRGVEVRAEAVVEWQDCDRQSRTAFDDHVDDALGILLTHEATPAWQGSPERWTALEEEFADLDELAARLGERAS